ncbi:MAG: TetM/TetW/TetO/TetS family tetracycline resistance ribosomal protection protein [Eubacterium sp.]|nr:TetM/TetW/TetO/TetS family tetracycline resistance ribosomal protection protein [Eubacterium sp.]
MGTNSVKRLSVGILAHVDAGKTTLTEALLYHTGAIRKLGRVDKKDAFLDTHELERSRGITIFSKQAVLSRGNDLYTLLDTPGHTDFSSETERVLQVLDYAVLLISGSDGVQNHTETLWELLKSYHIPVFLFVNKTDIADRSREELVSELVRKLDGKIVDFTGADGGDIEETDLGEAAALCDEALMTEFIETGRLSVGNITRAVKKRRLFPCFFGSALKLEGTERFLDCFSAYTAAPEYDGEFSARVFKITQDEQGNRLTHLKVTGGVLRARMQIGEGEEAEKINGIRIYSGNRFTAAEEVPAGTVCAVTGLSSAYAGKGLGSAFDAPLPMLEPLFSYKVILPPEVDSFTGLEILKRLEQEDPQLKVKWNETLGEIHLQLMGEIQLEVLKSIIAERFGINADFGEGSIAYKETIAAPVIGVGHYEPLRHYAEVHLLIEPSERGSGIRYAADCPPDTLGGSWQKLILSNLADKKHIGVLIGAPLTDVKITLIAGKAHLKHTEGGDFRQAACRAVRQGLRSAESVILEPWYRFELSLPREAAGHAMTDLQRMGAEFSEPDLADGTMIIKGEAPAARLRGYQSDVTAYTKGAGRLNCFPIGYRPCGEQEEVIKRIGYDCDGDLANSADSVFCSHGAGYAVKWYEAPEMMHIKTAETREKEFREAEKQLGIAVQNSFKQQRATEKELKEIFERTYGKINNAPNRFNERTKPGTAPKEKPYKALPVPTGPEYVLVDGYNIIFAWEELREKAKESLDYARNELVRILCNYQGYRRCELILVFDAYKVKGNKGEVEQVGGISIVYTKEAETADMYIEKTTRILGKRHRVRVATSDGLEQLIILGSSAMRVSAPEFYREVKETEREIRALIE